MSQPLRSRSSLPASRASSDLLMQRSRPNQTSRPIRDTTYEDEAEAALRTALATEELGIRTAVKLKEQTEQLRNIDDRIAAADQTLVSTDRSIRSMESFSGRLKNFFFRSDPKTDIQIRKRQEAKVIAKETKANEKAKVKQEKAKVKQEKAKVKQEKAMIKEQSKRSSPADEQLEMISGSVHNLRLLAEDINAELTVQNRMLSGIGHDVQSLQTRLEKQNRQIGRLG